MKNKKNNETLNQEIKVIDRRKHGCDGCHYNIPTERFDGFCGNHLWLCGMCQKELIKNGIPSQRIIIKEIKKAL